uniref:uncharacterized protein LOC120338842 isoform X2 n=1 Tax=Styela clava TaxID=7725 RepID=UPI001939AB46|nr:uncharacterized protein LOC120338842 isoform X2 [Styela clava]
MAAQDMKNVFAREELEANVTKYMENDEHHKSLSTLEKLLPLQSNTWSKISTKLKIIECQVALELHRPAVRSLDEIVHMAVQANINFNDVISAVDNLFETKNSNIQGFGMCYLASKLCRATTTGDDAVRGIGNCVKKIRKSVAFTIDSNREPNSRYIKILTGHIIPALKEILDDMNKIEDSTKKMLIEENAWCLLHIAKCFYFASDFISAKIFINKSITLLKSEFKDNAGKYQVLGQCYLDMGLILEKSDWKKAAEKYKESVIFLEEAEDFDSDGDKRQQIESATRKLTHAEKTCIIL